MIRLFLDIETLPADESMREVIAAEIKPPGTMTKAETISDWEKNKKREDVERRFRDTALNGDFGRLLCIGYIKEGPEGLRQEGVICDSSERKMLADFWELAKDVDVFVGHNVMDFDLKFIMKRSRIHSVRPSRELNFARYRSGPIYDTMQEWECWGRDGPGLDTLARVLGLPSSKEEMDGSKVYDAYKERRLGEICDYCKRDVVLVRKVYYKLEFLEE